MDAGDRIRQHAFYRYGGYLILLTGNGSLPHKLDHRSPTSGRSAHESCSIHLGGFVGFGV